MKHIIHIFGASGSGTTTLGRALAADMSLVHMDTDDYYWLPTDPKFTTARPIDTRLNLMQTDIDAAENGVVISGSLTDWGDPLIPQFTHAVRLITPTEVRIERLRQREYADFGDRIHEGGDMYENYLAFLDWAAQYDTGDVTMRSKACHDEWTKLLLCPLTVLRRSPIARACRTGNARHLWHPPMNIIGRTLAYRNKRLTKMVRLDT